MEKGEDDIHHYYNNNYNDNDNNNNHTPCFLTVEDLPLEVWDLVFAAVSKHDVLRASVVSRYFREASLASLLTWTINPGVFNHINLRSKREEALGSVLSFLTRYCIHLRHLSLANCYTISQTKGVLFPSTLHTLNLDRCSELTDKGLEHLPEQLRQLSLNGCTQVTDTGLKALPESLTDLNLANCRHLTDRTLRALPKGLKILNISACIKMTDTGIQQLPQGLTTLIMDDTMVHDSALRNLSPKLERLSIEHCICLTGASLHHLPPSITDLNVSLCTASLFNLHQLFHPQGILRLETRERLLEPHELTAFTNLTYLDLTDIPNTTLKPLLSELPPSIQVLILARTRVTHTDLTYLATTAPLMGLTMVDVRNCKNILDKERLLVNLFELHRIQLLRN